MKKIGYALKVCWAYYYFFIFALGFLLLYPAFYFTLRNKKYWPLGNRIRRVWARVLLIVTGIYPRIVKEMKLDPKKQYIFCPNHFSYLDIPIFIFCFSGDNFRFMAKAEFEKIPLFGIFFRTIDIPVNRGSATERFKALKKAETALNEGYSLIIFPEGGIGPHPPIMQPFKNGPFRLATDKKVPVVPIAYIDNWKILHVEKKIYGHPGRPRIHVFAPVDATHYTPEELKNTVYSLIQNKLDSYGGD